MKEVISLSPLHPLPTYAGAAICEARWRSAAGNQSSWKITLVMYAGSN